MANVTLATVTTKTSITKKSLHLPLNDLTLSTLIGELGRLLDTQQVAATATNYYTARHAGKMRRILIDTTQLAAASETMIFDVQKNGVSVLTSTPEIVHTTTPIGLFDVSNLIVAGTQVAVGDIISIVRTLASGSTLTVTGVSVEWGG